MHEIQKKRIEKGMADYADDLYPKYLPQHNIARAAFAAGAHYALSRQWISVEEALPPLLKRVLVKSEKTKKVGITYRYQNPEQQPKWLNYEYVTWWMPIPGGALTELAKSNLNKQANVKEPF